MFLAFAAPVSVFLMVVRRSPKLVIVMVTRYTTPRCHRPFYVVAPLF